MNIGQNEEGHWHIEKFKDQLDKNVHNVARVEYILLTLKEFSDYARERGIIDRDVFQIFDENIVISIIRMVKYNSEIRKDFRGKLVSLESGLHNYALFLKSDVLSEDGFQCEKRQNEMKSSQCSEVYEVEKHDQNIEKFINIDDTSAISYFVEWCNKKNYKHRTIKGFISAIHSAESYLMRHGTCMDIFCCTDRARVEAVTEQLLGFPDFGRNAQANILYALRIYCEFLEINYCSNCSNDVGGYDKDKRTIESKKEETFETKIATSLIDYNFEQVKKAIQQFPMVGLYMTQIVDITMCDKESVKRVLESNPPWVKREGSRYYYSETDSDWKDILYENSSEEDETNSIIGDEINDNSYSDQEISEMLCNPEAFIKERIKKRKL